MNEPIVTITDGINTIINDQNIIGEQDRNYLHTLLANINYSHFAMHSP